MSNGPEIDFRDIMESAPDAIVITDGQGTIVMANAQVEELFGYNHEDLLGQPVEVLVPERLRAQHEAHRTDYHHTPRTRPMGANLALFGQRKDGSQFPVEISLSPKQTRVGLLVTAIIRDVTLRQELERQLAKRTRELEEANAALEQLAATDTLTGVATRHRSEDVLKKCVPLARSPLPDPMGSRST